MKKLLLILLGMTAVLIAGCSSDNNNRSSGEYLYYMAQSREAVGAYIAATELYQQALPLLRQEGNSARYKPVR